MVLRMTGNHVGSTLGSSNLPLGAIKTQPDSKGFGFPFINPKFKFVSYG